MHEQGDKLLQPKQYRYESEPSQIRCGDGYGDLRAKQACGKQGYHAEILAKDDCDFRYPPFCVEAKEQKQVVHVGRNEEYEAQDN
jgi:hypothetical protein